MINLEDGSLVLCGAKSKRNRGAPCRQPAMANGRCRLHGGKCTGPKTQMGLDRARRANWKHGYYSSDKIAERKGDSLYLRLFKENLRGLNF